MARSASRGTQCAEEDEMHRSVCLLGVEARQWAQQESGPLTERIPGTFAVRSVSNTDVAQD